jgi:hypothetical protein
MRSVAVRELLCDLIMKLWHPECLRYLGMLNLLLIPWGGRGLLLWPLLR